MSNFDFKINFKLNLPHIQLENSFIAITFRLAHSLSNHLLNQLLEKKNNFEETLKSIPLEEKPKFIDDYKRDYFEYFDLNINNSKNSIDLTDSFISQILKDTIHFYDDKKYDLIAYCIMPNHVHMILCPLIKDTDQFYSLSEIMFSIKKFSSNKIKKNETIWNREYYDHLIRSDIDLDYQLNYLIQNPVKAKLVDNWEDWKHTYVKRM